MYDDVDAVEIIMPQYKVLYEQWTHSKNTQKKKKYKDVLLGAREHDCIDHFGLLILIIETTLFLVFFFSILIR